MDPALKELMEGIGEDEIEAIVRLDPEGSLPAHVRVVSRFGEIATVRLPRGRIAETWADESVVSLKAARPFGLDPDPLPFDASLEAAEAFEDPDDTRRPEGLDATGRGAIVAVLDWGFDFAHPNFRRRDGSTRVLALWDQSASGAGPQPYGYGRVYTREEIDRALRHDEPYRALGYHPATGDPTGYGAHGTHVLDIAAGNGRAEGSPSGIAPEAELLFVHLATRGTEGRANLGDSVTLLEALDWVARQAGDRPWVVNLSVGRHGGPHTGLTLVEQGIDALLAAGPGRAVVQSTGNYFGSNVHASGYLRPGQERTLRWWTDRADVTPNELEVWYPGADVFEVVVRSPGGDAEVRVPLGGQASIQVGDREAGRVYHRAKDPGNGDNHIDVFLYPQAPAGCWQMALIGEDVIDGRFHAWVERDPGCPTCQSRLDPGDADPTGTTGTIANGFRSIAVGAYDAHSDDRRLGAFSSSGPTRDGRLKPDLLAPGVGVLAARSASLELGSDTPLLTRNSGTSMAAPHVTGTVALMFEVAPRPLTIQETRKLLLSTAREARFDAEPAARLGSGYLDIERAVEAARSFAVPAAAPGPRKATEDFHEILAWIGPEEQEHEQEEVEAFDDGGTDKLELEDSVDDEHHAHPCRCGGRAAEAEAEVEAEAAPPCECGCRGSDREEDETSRWEPEWDSAEPEWEEMESALREPAAEAIEPAEPVAGWWNGELSPATLFDCMVAGGAVQRHLETWFEVLALPGQVPLESPQDGDFVVRRALGEGSIAHMAPAAGVMALDPAGRLPFDQLLVRPRTSRPVWPESMWESTSPAAVCAGPATVLDRFGSDSSKLIPDHDPILDKVAKEIADSQSTSAPVEAVCVVGHTDDSGSKGHNTGLGKDRAKAAEAALRTKVKALSPALSARLRITPTSKGEDAPAASNSTADGKAKNRRVEITLARGVKKVCPKPPVSKDDPTALNLFPVATKSFGPVAGAVSGATVQGSVFYPADGAGSNKFNTTITAPVPIVFMAHGNHRAFTDPADPDTDHCTAAAGLTPVPNHEGFDYFQSLLARMGIIAVSVDCNSTCDFGMSASNVMDRAKLVIDAMLHFRSGGDPALAGHVDFERVGLMGHSRGGEAVLAVAEGITGLGKLLSFLGIELSVKVKGVLALAPSAIGATTGKPSGFPFLTILPAADGDVIDNGGAQFYDQAVPSPFKCQLYVHRANHNFFNRQWTNDDTLGEPGLLSRLQHESILSAYGCAFFRDVLLGHSLRKLLRVDELPPGVPASNIHVSFEESGFTTVDDHEDASITDNTLLQTTASSGGLTADQFPFTQAGTPFNTSFFGNTVGMVATPTTTSGRFRSPLAAPADLTGREVWIRAAEVYNGSTIPAGATGFRLGLEDAGGTISFADTVDAGGLPRPFHRKALDARLATAFGVAAFDLTKSMPKTLRYKSGCFAKKGFDITRVQAIVIELNRGDKRPLAFDQLQIV